MSEPYLSSSRALKLILNKNNFEAREELKYGSDNVTSPLKAQ